MQDPVSLLEEFQRLMVLKGENPFKVRAFERAASEIADRSDLVERAKEGTLTEIPGVGKGIAEVLTEFLLHGRSTARDELRASLPPGLEELTQIPGVGPKKAIQLIEELGITTVGELEYACRENRLLKLKGFGPKMQDKILEGISFRNSGKGRRRLDEVFPIAEKALAELLKSAGGLRVSETGALRRRMETLEALEFLVEAKNSAVREKLETVSHNLREKLSAGLPVQLHFSEPARFGYELARTTGTPEHWQALGAPAPFEASTEEEFFKKIGLPVIPPEARETGEEVAMARSGGLAKLLPWDGIRGVFHNHTTRSDGVASLEEMVIEARRLGFEYIGISDHSQSAFYAQGLKPADLASQEREIRQVQEKHPEIRVFWGIESDILADGSLDYDENALKKFDFVIGSIHSRFQMDRETMTRRVLEAIRHPATRFLGHATGRLLLGRKGYDLDMEKIIEECARRNVAIEVNANPARLDIDWRWGKALRAAGTVVSVNPDAHSAEELSNTRFGVAVARKALLGSDQVVNSRSVAEVEKWLKRQ